MCKPFSCIATKGKRILTCENPNMHSHEDIVQEHNLKDSNLINRYWVRTEVYPQDYNYISDVDTWKFKVDEWDTLPEWFTLDKEVYEKKCRETAQKWKDNCVDKLGQYCIEDIYGNKKWYKEQKIHREDGPAIELANGDKEWYIDGLLHRSDGPALDHANGDKEWFIYGLLHREDGPSLEHANGDRAWYINDKCHREDGPAEEYANGDKEWYKEGKLHRSTGAAVEKADGSSEYWLEGKQVEDFGILV